MKILTPHLKIKVLGQGRAWPGSKPVTNYDILKIHPKHKDKDDDHLKKFAKKLESTYGFSKRYLSRMPDFSKISQIDVSQEETSESLSLKACQFAVNDVNHKKEINSFVHGTTTSSRYTGSQAPAILSKLKSFAPGFEIKAGCSTSLVSLHFGISLLLAGYENTLVSCAETLSKVMHPDLQETWFVLADGGAALWIEKNEQEPDFLVKKIFYQTDGDYVDMYTVQGKLPPHSKAFERNDYYMYGDGAKLREQAIKRYKMMIRSFFPNQEDLKQIKWLIPHQINRGIIEEICKETGLEANMIWSADEFGNVGGTSVLFSLSEAIEKDIIQKGDEVLMMSVGGGLTYAIQHWKKL